MKDGQGKLIEAGDPQYLGLWQDYFRALGNPKPVVGLPAQVVAKHDMIKRAVDDPKFWANPSEPSEAVQQLNRALSVEEVEESIRSAPMGKSSGPDGFSNEILKAVGAAGI